MKKKLSILVLSFVIAVAFVPAYAFADTAPAMKAYDQVLKSGSTVYCGGAAGIYKVKVKKGKVKSKKLIYKSYAPFDNYSYIGSMYKKGKYIYFMLWTEGTLCYLKRVSTSGKSKKLASLEESCYGYSIGGNRIFYDTYDWDRDAPSFMEMNLDGTGKKASSVRANATVAKTNAKGYKAVIKKNGQYLKDYLKTPKGTYYLGKIKKN